LAGRRDRARRGAPGGLCDDLPPWGARRARRGGGRAPRPTAQGGGGGRPRPRRGPRPRGGGRRPAGAAGPGGRARAPRGTGGPATAKYRELGTLANLLAFNAISALPTRNFQAATFAGAPRLAAEELAELRTVARSSCASCTIGCEHIYAGGGRTMRVEYENVFALGPMCGVSDPDAVLAASGLCDELGLDTISAGGTIAWAMECAERGLIGAPWLRFGNADALLRAVAQIGAREGLGDLLAEGS